MPYTPDPTDATNPLDVGIDASTAAAEFRAIKAYYLAQFAAVGTNYLPLTGGNLSGNLNGTTADFSGTVEGANFYTGLLTSSAGTVGVAGPNGAATIYWGNASAGLGNMDLYAGGFRQGVVANIPSAVNYVSIAGGVLGNRTGITAAGSDTDVGLSYTSKGAGDHAFFGNSGTQLQIASTLAATKYWSFAGGAAGNPTVVAGGGATALDVNSAWRNLAPGVSPGGAMGTAHTFYGADKICFVDPTQAANAKEIEFFWSSGTFALRYVNDAYGAAVNAMTVTGSSSAITDLAFPSGASFGNVARAGVNTLDWYEEGTFTPVLRFGGASVGITYSIQSGSFTRIGNSVSARILLNLTAKGSSVGNASIAGLPYTPAGTATAIAGVIFGNFGLMSALAAGSQYCGIGTGGSAILSLGVYNETGASSGPVGIADTSFTGTSVVELYFEYKV
jgi:hypothetical protein